MWKVCCSRKGKDKSGKDEGAFCVSRDNVEDALEKMQACIDSAAESLIPAEVDPEKQKQIAKQ